ncbi:LysR family transcriptional regulator [Breoghania sp. L-A4]|nr:LysR family transcriptional regulator [Breoghania sp. L-A4]
MPRLSEIRYLVAAAENGSLRKAAELLGVGQSCVSRKIMRLEEKLGVSLLERGNTGVRLTNAGQRHLEEVQDRASATGPGAARSPFGGSRRYRKRSDRRSDITCRRFPLKAHRRLSAGISEDSDRGP